MNKRRGQTVVEYAILVTLVIAALITMSQYIKRGLQGRWKDSVDSLGDQYDPNLAVTDITHSVTANTITRMEVQRDVAGDWTRKVDQTNAVYHTEGALRVGAQ